VKEHIGRLSCVPGARAVTYYGRWLITNTNRIVMETFGSKAEIVYGDTDSVMIEFICDGKTDEEKRIEAWKLSKIAETKINEWVLANMGPMSSIVVEKMFFPFVIWMKKSYAGMKWGGPLEKDRIGMDMSGVVGTKHDTCGFMRELANDIVERIVTKKFDDMETFVQAKLLTLAENKVPLEQLVVTKELADDPENYKGKTLPAHVMVAKQMIARGDKTNTRKKSRINYAFVDRGTQVDSTSERVEDIDHIKRNHLKLDLTYYLTNQIMTPITTLLSVFDINIDALFAKPLSKTSGFSYGTLYSFQTGGSTQTSSKAESKTHVKKETNSETSCSNLKTLATFDPSVAINTSADQNAKRKTIDKPSTFSSRSETSGESAPPPAPANKSKKTKVQPAKQVVAPMFRF
jgi:DNA polymerase elongation subunit (family B)